MAGNARLPRYSIQTSRPPEGARPSPEGRQAIIAHFGLLPSGAGQDSERNRTVRVIAIGTVQGKLLIWRPLVGTAQRRFAARATSAGRY